ncbi:hypothetical protein VSR82_17250 [Burkholderia sp. JPY481]|uniref:hypothetical protein n=1 Tax=Paraburkholderia sp. JPY465 TaxID=3042285 RepID=UPI003175681B
MPTYVSLSLLLLPLLGAGCNTPSIPLGKPVNISIALEQALKGSCNFSNEQAAQRQARGVDAYLSWRTGQVA